MATGHLWEVVGGGEKGGLVVRAGKELGSAEEAERLSTGAIVSEIELVGNRLRYRKVNGGGPDTGWVSLALKEKPLLVRAEKAPGSVAAADGGAKGGAPAPAPAPTRAAAAENGVTAPPEPPRPSLAQPPPKLPLRASEDSWQLARGSEAAKVPHCFRFRGERFTEPRQLVRLKRQLFALEKPVKALLATRGVIESGGGSFERLNEHQEELCRALARVRAAAEDLDPPLEPPARGRARCATPGCSFLVHSRETLAGYCCGECYKSGEAARERERTESSKGLWQRSNALHLPGTAMRGGQASLPGFQAQFPSRRPGGPQLSGWPGGRQFLQGPQTTRPGRLLEAVANAPAVSSSHDWRCERQAAPASASRASRAPKPADPEELCEIELEEAVRLLKAYSSTKRSHRKGPDNSWLEGDPNWTRSGEDAIGKWVSSIAKDEWGSPDTTGPKQMLEGGLWISRKGRNSNQWLVFDLGSERLVSEVLTRGSHANTRHNPKAMKWQVGRGEGGEPPVLWDDVTSFTGGQDSSWSVAAVTPPRRGRWWRLFIVSNWGGPDYVWLCGIAVRSVWKDDSEKTEEELQQEEEEKREEEKKRDKEKKERSRKTWTKADLRKTDEAFEPLWGYQKLLYYGLLSDKVLFFQDKPYIDRRWQAPAEFVSEFLQQPAEEGWTLDYDPNFFCELAYEGFNPITIEIPSDADYMIQVLSPCFEPGRNTVDCLETHVSKRVQKCAHQYTMSLDTAYDDVMLGCIRQHGEAWLYRGQRWLHRKLFREGYTGEKNICLHMHSIELWDADGQLVAGDLGYTVGGLYVSQTGFRSEGTKGAGEVQLVLTAALLHKMGHHWFDLGQANPYKSLLGARTLDRVTWLERFRGARDRRCTFKHDKIEGGELLRHLLQAKLDAETAREAQRALSGPWAALPQPRPRVLECPSDWGLTQAWQHYAKAADSSGEPALRQFVLRHSGGADGEAFVHYLLTLPCAAAMAQAEAGGRFPLVVYLHSAMEACAEEDMAKWLPALADEAPHSSLIEAGRSKAVDSIVCLAPRCSPLWAEGAEEAAEAAKGQKPSKRQKAKGHKATGSLLSAAAEANGTAPEDGPMAEGKATEETVELSFPSGFLWGTATAAYQIEGAAAEGGRSPSIWDTFCSRPGKVANGDTGEVACDHYRRWREDVQIMKDLSMPAYRFSISWSRLLPKGRGEANPEAVAFYGGLIDELRSQGVRCVVTIYHWDLPQCLEDEYRGWLSRKVIDDFEHFAATCFSNFGDRVSLWITLNEPWCSAALGYANGEMAPGRKEMPDSEPYLAAHHMLLAHARAVRRYRQEFQAAQGGQIGISLNVAWHEPLTSSHGDREAAQRALDFSCGWFADPIWQGDYPESMRARCRERLPSFTEAEKELLRGSSDFFGLNHYTTSYASAPARGAKPSGPRTYFSEQGVQSTDDPRWPRTDMDWAVVPWGLRRLCEYIHRRYAPAHGLFITENGCAARERTAAEAKEDAPRVEYLRAYVAQLHQAIEAGADVRGYFAWSFMDNFEWAYGYGKRFGLVRVDYKTQERSVKASGRMFAELARTNTLRISARLLAASCFRRIRDCDWQKAKRALWFKSMTEDAYDAWDFSKATRCIRAEQLVLGLIASALEQLPVDPSRVYIMGSSLGGYGALRLAELAPTLPAAVVPMAGYYPDVPGQDHDAGQLAERLRGVPRVWPLHCEYDKTCRKDSPAVARLYKCLRETLGVKVDPVPYSLARGTRSDYHWAQRAVTDDPEAFFGELLRISRSPGASAADLRHRIEALKSL